MIFLHYEISRRNEKPSAVYFCSVRAKDGNRIVHFQILLRLTLLKVRKYSQVYPFSMNHSLKVACVIVTCDTINLFFFFKEEIRKYYIREKLFKNIIHGKVERICLFDFFFFQLNAIFDIYYVLCPSIASFRRTVFQTLYLKYFYF